jgi:ribonuclease HI
MKEIKIFTDGGSRGNPGPAAIGVYIVNDNKKALAKLAGKIGTATNNEAEYKALLKGLDWVLENQKKFENETRINFYLDSQLVYSQVIGIYKVKNERLRNFIFELRQKEAQIKLPLFYNHIPREKNYEADKLVNLALDNLL